MAQTTELGLGAFGDVTVDAAGRPLTQADALRNVVEQAVLADLPLYGTKVLPRVGEMADYPG
jgi:hypothetical protein